VTAFTDDIATGYPGLSSRSSCGLSRVCCSVTTANATLTK
jgi:hypothetical protein